jgi:dTDP-4-dehydrorhamnose 3,5-epimerase-like enzyme/dTDP-4-dehydrorhamnose reductase
MFKDCRGTLHSIKNLPFEPKEILVSENAKNVVRGLHMSPYPKIIYVTRGSIHDFFWTEYGTTQVTLHAGESLLIPAGAAHGFYAIEESEVVYLLGGTFDPAVDRNIHWQTPEFNFNFEFDTSRVILSAKDADAAWFHEYDYLVLGASGFLGKRCVEALRAAGKTVFESRARLADTGAIRQQVAKSRTKYVICAAGISGRPTIDWCDDHEQETFETNYLDVLNLMRTSRECGVHLTIFGSGAVYTGAKERYTEDDQPEYDTKVYCRLRCWLERHVTEGVLYLRIMYPCTFDGDPKCFRTKMLARKDTVHDGAVSVTPVPDLFPHLPTLIEGRVSGIFNFVSDGTVSLKTLAGVPTTSGAAPSRGGYELVADKLSAYIPVIKTVDVILDRCGSS